MRIRRARPAGDFQRRYRAYALDHGMTSQQMLVHDKHCCADAMLKPYLLWASRRWFEWSQLNPDCAHHGAREESAFEHWLDGRSPALDGFTCECHLKLACGRKR